MKFQSHFEIGQTVYFMHRNEVVKSTIKGIFISVEEYEEEEEEVFGEISRKIATEETYSVWSTDGVYQPSKLFRTKEDLLNSL